MKKKLLTSVLTVLIVCISSLTFAAAKPFTDVPNAHWAYNGVMNLANNGIISAYDDGAFYGNRNATRYEVACMVANLYCKKTNTQLTRHTNPFSDLPSGHWALNAVTTLADAGIEKGTDDGTFRGNRFITRYELATVLANLLKATGTDVSSANANPFKDVPKDNPNYEGVMIMAGTGLMEGYGDGSFNGDKMITRYEVAMILNHVYKMLIG